MKPRGFAPRGNYLETRSIIGNARLAGYGVRGFVTLNGRRVAELT
jgi:hypothetical protein